MLVQHRSLRCVAGIHCRHKTVSTLSHLASAAESSHSGWLPTCQRNYDPAWCTTAGPHGPSVHRLSASKGTERPQTSAHEADNDAHSNNISATTSSSLIVASARSTNWPQFLSVLAVSGAVVGTLLDGIHSRVGLQIYQLGAIELGPLRTSLAVPPLLAAFYVVAGSLVPWLDRVATGPSSPSTIQAATQQAQQRAGDLGHVTLGVGLLAAALQLSAWAFESGLPYSQISLLLGTVSLALWAGLDRTPQTVALSLLVALGAPAAEIVLLHFVPLWYYPRADAPFGFVSWVPWCYAFYTPVLSNFARYVWQRSRV